MRLIDTQWTDLAAGYRMLPAARARLEAEFGRALQIGSQRKYQRDLAEWRKKRRIFFALVAIAPLSLIGLCAAAVYFREVACVIAYWVLVVLVILATLAVAGRSFIREAINPSGPGRTDPAGIDLEGRWWACLAPAPAALPADFLDLQVHSLPDDFLGVRLSPQEVVLVGPSGAWFFVLCDWEGSITRREGSWRQLQTVRDRLGRKHTEETVQTSGPDDEWLRRRLELTRLLPARPGAAAPTAELLQGGVVFSSPQAVLDRERIQGNSSAYGSAQAWGERLRGRKALDDFPVETRLEWLEALAAGRRQQGVSAEVEVGRLYEACAAELRALLVPLVQE